MKKSLLAATLMSLFLAACGGQPAPAPEKAASEAAASAVAASEAPAMPASDAAAMPASDAAAK